MLVYRRTLLKVRFFVIKFNVVFELYKMRTNVERVGVPFFKELNNGTD